MSTENTAPSINIHEKPHLKRGWTWWIVPKPFDLVTSLLYISVPLLSIFFGSDCTCPSLPWWRSALMVVIVVVLLAIDRVEYWVYGEKTPIRAAIALMITRIVLIEAITELDHLRFSPFLYLIIPLLSSLYFGILVGYVFAGLSWMLYVVKEFLFYPAWLSNPDQVHNILIYTVGLIFAIAMANAFLRERCSRSRTELLLSELEASHRQLKAYSEQVAELATTKERNRLARDIHDTLGHYLTVINVQLEKALAFRDKRPQEADQAVSDAKRLASEALQDARRSVGALRTTQEHLSFVPAMRELVDHMQNNQFVVDLTIEGDEKAFPKQSVMTLYRVAQEGLTNVQKHSQASHVWIDMQFGVEEASLSLRDDGCGFDLAILQTLQQGHEGGYGLQGLQERLALVGGCLDIKSKPGEGTSLVATIPKDGYGKGIPASLTSMATSINPNHR